VQQLRTTQPDKRSYRVGFTRFTSLAQQRQPAYDFERAVVDIRDGLQAMRFDDKDFRPSSFMRLRVLDSLSGSGLLNEELRWSFRT
jgi:hypothetical protein